MRNSQYQQHISKQFSFSSNMNDEMTLPKLRKLSENMASQRGQRLNFEYNSNAYQNKQNRALFNSKFGQSFRTDRDKSVQQEMDIMSQEHLVEVERLLLQISRLHDLCYDLQKSKVFQIQKTRQECENQMFSHITSIKQSHTNKIEGMQYQIRKYKQELNRKTDEFRQLQKMSKREKQILTFENERLKNELKQNIERKNDELFNLKISNEKQAQKINKENQKKINVIKEQFDEEMANLKKMLHEKSRVLDKISEQRGYATGQVESLLKKIEEGKMTMEMKIIQNNRKANQRMEAQRARLQQIFGHEFQDTKKTYDFQISMLKDEIQRLMNILSLKDQQIIKLNAIHEAYKNATEFHQRNLQDQNEYLKNMIKRSNQQHLQQQQLLKVKMAALYETDIKQLVSLYQTKIQGLSNDVKRVEQDKNRTRAFLQDEIHKKLEMKKKYDTAISRLNSKLLQVKLGMTNMESEFKDKLENERSLMLITSKSFIKQTELKNNNAKFYEQQLRKLRQLLDVQTRQTAVSEQNVQEKIKCAEEELIKLSNKIIKLKTEGKEKQQQYQRIIQEKEEKIKELNDEVIAKRVQQSNEKEQQYQKTIADLEHQLSCEKQKTQKAKDAAYQNQKKANLYKAQMEQLRVEQSINNQQTQEKFRKISEENMKQLKNHYERRLKQIQGDKGSLKDLNNSLNDQLTELAGKYKDLQASFKQMVSQSKKLRQLQEKVINLGMDNNLVKNMAQIFKR